MATIKPTTIPDKTLSEGITDSSTSFKLVDIKGWDGNALTSADFGSVAYAVFRDSNATIMEIIEFDPTTIASTSITINKRGLKFDGDLTTEVTANKRSWVKGATQVSLGTNVPQLLMHYVDTLSAQTIAGIKTFSSLPATSAGDPVANNDLARKSYVDSIALGTLTTINVIIPGTAGETIAAGNGVYFDTTTNNWKLTDADTATTVENVLLGIAQGAGTSGNSITGGIMLRGVDENQSGLTIGSVYYASNTTGGISATPGTKEVTMGIGKTATSLYFSPRFNQIITEDQQDALAGTSGTPSASNLFVTADDVSSAAGSGKIVRANGTALPALDGSNLIGLSKLYARLAGYSAPADTTENTVLTQSIVGNTLGLNSAIRLTLPFNMGNNISASNAVTTIRFKFGGSTLITVTATEKGGSSASGASWVGTLTFLVINNSSLSAQNVGVIVEGGPQFSDTVSNYLSVSVSNPADATSAINTANTQTLAVTVQKAVAGSATPTFKQSIIEIIN